MIKGSLEEKLKEVKKTNTDLEKQKEISEKEFEKLSELKRKKRELSYDISNHLLNDEQIKTPLLDYCFRHFAESAFEKVPIIEKFMKHIEEFKGEKILSAQKDNLRVGVISGPCEFKVEKTYRYLYVPLKELFKFNEEKEKWEKNDKSNLLFINGDIFQHHINIFSTENLSELTKIMGGKKINGYFWEADYSQSKYIGGSGPTNIRIYIGNDFVERGLKENSDYTIPPQTRKMPRPKF